MVFFLSTTVLTDLFVHSHKVRLQKVMFIKPVLKIKMRVLRAPKHWFLAILKKIIKSSDQFYAYRFIKRYCIRNSINVLSVYDVESCIEKILITSRFIQLTFVHTFPGHHVDQKSPHPNPLIIFHNHLHHIVKLFRCFYTCIHTFFLFTPPLAKCLVKVHS